MFAGGQSRVGSVLTQLNLQSVSQPSPFTELPSSHSSPGSTTPSPPPASSPELVTAVAPLLQPANGTAANAARTTSNDRRAA